MLWLGGANDWRRVLSIVPAHYPLLMHQDGLGIDQLLVHPIDIGTLDGAVDRL